MATSTRNPSRAASPVLYERIAHELAEKIRARKLAAFAKLPSEAELMQRHGVSRVTVRKALAKLAEQGLVTAHQGKGVFVAGVVVKQELSELVGFYDSLVRQGYEPETSVLEFERIRPSVATPELRQFEFDIYRFRRLYRIGEMPIAIADVWFPSFGTLVTRQDVERLPVYAVIKSLLQRTVTRASVQVRAGKAAADAARLLDMRPGGTVLKMDRTSHDASGLVLEVTRYHIQPEVFAFQMEVAGPLQISSSIRRIDR